MVKMSYKSYNDLPKSSKYNFNGPPCPVVTSIPHKKKIIQTTRIAIFKISAHWCEPCRRIAPIVDELASKINKPGEIMISAEDFDDKLSADVHSVPAFDYYFEGRKVHRQSGADVDELKRNIQMMLSGPTS